MCIFQHPSLYDYDRVQYQNSKPLASKEGMTLLFAEIVGMQKQFYIVLYYCSNLICLISTRCDIKLDPISNWHTTKPDLKIFCVLPMRSCQQDYQNNELLHKTIEKVQQNILKQQKRCCKHKLQQARASFPP